MQRFMSHSFLLERPIDHGTTFAVLETVRFMEQEQALIGSALARFDTGFAELSK